MLLYVELQAGNNAFPAPIAGPQMLYPGEQSAAPYQKKKKKKKKRNDLVSYYLVILEVVEDGQY